MKENHSVDPERIERDIERIAAFSETAPEIGYSRPTFSESWIAARDYVIAEAYAAGARARIDAFGNVHIRPRDRSWDEPLWLCGSHIDSVPSGGKYDGVGGVICALELIRIDAAVELVIFAEEEGTTFGLGMLGSRGWVGTIGPGELGSVKNRHGESYLEAGRACGVNTERMKVDRIDTTAYHGFFELHPEQGLSLWNREIPAAAVYRINGRRQYRIVLEGQGNHAGSTRMNERRDALAGAARAISAVETLGNDLARRLDYTVMTVGHIETQANAVNVIAGRVEFTVDFRAQESEILEDGDRRLRETLETIAEERKLKISLDCTEEQTPEPLNEELVERLHRAAEALGIALTDVPSGALHDAAIIAPFLPTAMVFVASRDGISHDPTEFSRIRDIADATRIVAGAVTDTAAIDPETAVTGKAKANADATGPERVSLETLNTLERKRFVDICGGFYEESPWIAERAWGARPFASITALHAACTEVIEGAGEDAQVKLIRKHPDLVGRLAREGRVTRESSSEQAAAGLDQLSEEEIRRFERLNDEYRTRFGFPFVICARENRKEAILAAFPARVKNDRRREIQTALYEIGKIAFLRMQDRLTEAAQTRSAQKGETR